MNQWSQDSGHQVIKDSDPRVMRNLQVSPMIALTYCLERVSRKWHRERGLIQNLAELRG